MTNPFPTESLSKASSICALLGDAKTYIGGDGGRPMESQLMCGDTYHSMRNDMLTCPLTAAPKIPSPTV